MEELLLTSNTLINKVDNTLVRNAPHGINYQWRLNGLVGARGTGKTTRMLQELKMLQSKGHRVLYASLDDFYFATHSPVELARQFAADGGEYLYFDEVHKFADWGMHIKNIYDTEDRLHVLFSGSSVLQINSSGGDLSRRALMYTMPGLSFREYLLLKHKISLPVYTLEDIVNKHTEIAGEILAQIRPLQYFGQYLEQGYYPFFLEKNRNYVQSLSQIVKYILEVDLSTISGYQGGQLHKLMKILLTVAQNPPFDFNATRVAQAVGLNRNTLLHYLYYLKQAGLITHLNYPNTSISNLTKPDKMLLHNPSLYHCLGQGERQVGSVRESFWVSQVAYQNEIFLHSEADFQVQDLVFEIGGRNKKVKPGKKAVTIYTIKDGIEMGAGNTIPLYLFGFLY
jgi:hypothetical protein